MDEPSDLLSFRPRPAVLHPLDLYEICVQSPRHVASMLRKVHRGHAVTLREDFCGTAAVARRWCLDALRAGDSARAIAIDADGPTVAHARKRAEDDGLRGQCRVLEGDCLAKHAPAADEPADIVFAGNFSIGYAHRRTTLMGYLKRSLARLRASPLGPGVLAVDTYGGADAMQLGQIRRRHIGPRGEIVHYLWTHEYADPVTGMVTNSISFEVERDGEIIDRQPRTFVYEWRLWSIAELREAMLEAGFAAVDVYREVAIAPEQPPEPVADPAELGANWVVLVVGRATA